MPRLGLELKIPVFERAKTVDAVDRSTTVIGLNSLTDLTLLKKEKTKLAL
jgi:hypothetical protein